MAFLVRPSCRMGLRIDQIKLTAAKPISIGCRNPRQPPFYTTSTKHSHPILRHTNTTCAKEARAFPTLLVVGVVFFGGAYYLLAPSSPDKTLNETSFVPYAVTAREAISPSSFILTIIPKHPHPSLPYLLPDSSVWKHSQWSVEFKQPEVQIARHYTPLPPVEGEDPTDGRLRFYLRAIDGGEMSNYLSRLSAGRDAWLRGPHAGFDITQRLGSRKRVVFLAGGTGVAPAMQVANAVLDGDTQAHVSLLWAIRKREEMSTTAPEKPGLLSFWRSKVPKDLHVDLESPSPIARQLRDMKFRFGDRFTIKVAIDEEHMFFRDGDIRKAMTSGAASSDPSTPSALVGHDCPLHDQKIHELLSEFDQIQGSCKCPVLENAQPGKNLLLVSGPDGFISHYTGPKVWLGGRHTQGPVNGVAGQLQQRYPQLAKEWLVLKL